jgi:hypothetical protein
VTPAYLICDAGGVYQVVPNPLTGKMHVTWMFTPADYHRLMVGIVPGTGRLSLQVDLDKDGTFTPADLAPALVHQNLPPFLPTSVQKLPNGDFLITNSATGKSGYFAGGKFNGEVFQVNPNIVTVPPGTYLTQGTATTARDFSAPYLLKAVPSLSNPIPLNEQKMGKDTSITGLLEQPLFSLRL